MRLVDRVIGRTLPAVPKSIVRRAANRYIAGETTDEALRLVAELNARGFRATLNILGEHIQHMDQARRGVVVQASLRRTMNDVCMHEDLKPNYRLCKGVYVEPLEISYHDMRVINRNYAALLEKMFRNGSYVGIATHDELMVWEAYRIIRELRLPTAYEFQMLLGVEEQLRDIIHAAGHNLRVYIPFGRDWYAYSVRRLRENPRLAGYVFKAMFKS